MAPQMKQQMTSRLSPIAAAVVLGISSHAAHATQLPDVVNTGSTSNTLIPTTPFSTGDSLNIYNTATGTINVTTTTTTSGILVNIGGDSSVFVDNAGLINTKTTSTSSVNTAHGINIMSGKVSINNTGSVTAAAGTANSKADAIHAESTGNGVNGGISITSTGSLNASNSAIFGKTAGNDTTLSVNVSGDIQAGSTTSNNRDAISLTTTGNNSIIDVGFSSGSIKTSSTTGSTSAGGIRATTSGQNSLIQIKTSQGTTISTAANNASGIYAANTGSTNGGDILIESGSNISINGATSMGIRTLNNTGNTSITSTGDIETMGANGHGIYTESRTANAGNIEIHASGSIKTAGSASASDASGIRSYMSSDTSGNTSVIYDGPAIALTGGNSDGIFIQTDGSGNVSVKTTGGTISTAGSASTAHGIVAIAATGNTLIDNASDISTAASTANSQAISARTTSGSVTVVNTGNITTAGLNSLGIRASSTAAGTYQINQDQVSITNSGKVRTSGDLAYGITAMSGGGAVHIDNSGDVITQGAATSAIFSNIAKGNINIENTGNLITQGDATATNNAATIFTKTTEGNAAITHSGEITNTGKSTGNSGVTGILASAAGTGTTAGNATITASGNITIAENTGSMTSTTLYHNGLEAISHGGTAQVNYLAGNLKISGNGDGYGITAWNELSGEANTSAIVNVGTTGQSANVTASGLNNIGILVTSKTNEVTIGENAKILGGYGAGAGGIALGTNGNQTNSTNSTLTNFGTIGALNDVATNANMSTGTATINNHGTITGTVNSAGAALILNNLSNDSWDIRNFADTDGDGVRDVKSIAISDFGSNANSIINNESTGTIRLSNVMGESSVNTAGQYLADGLSTYDTNNSGVMQAQILNLARFENRGTIDLTGGSNVAGNTLIISGGNIAGSNGGGTFVSDGGSLKMNVVLNEGADKTQSDLLVVDNVTTGTKGATKITVNSIGNTDSTLTKDNGIKLVEVEGTSSNNAFALNGLVANGAYEYQLFQGDVSGAGDSWYLRNFAQNNPDKPFINPAAGTFVANQTAAVGMFMHTLHDRIGEPQFTEGHKDGDKKIPSAWLRVEGHQTKNEAGNGSLDQKTDSYVVHLGGELAKWENETNRIHFGVMGGYGQADTHTQSNLTGSTAKGNVTGYNLGVYGTWFGNKDLPQGPYLDGWLQYSRFNNEVTGNNRSTSDYDSNAFTASIEGGYAFLIRESNARQLMIEPQVQIAYTDYSQKNYTDPTGLRVSGSDAGGLLTRVGARIYSKTKINGGLQPFAEVNWYNGNGGNSLVFNNVRVSEDTPDNTVEAKLGLQGEIAKGVQLWGHVSGQWGANSFSRFGGLVGIKKSF